MTTTDTTAAMTAAERLIQAAAVGVPCEPVRDIIGADDDALAYEVQSLLAADRRARGARVVGHKIGLTSPAVQKQLGVDRPDFGKLFDDMQVAVGETVDMDQLLQPKVEAEIAFVLSADITDPDADAASVRAAVAYASPALEIVDSRIAAWDISYVDTVADNASSGLFVLGEARVSLDDFEPREATMSMSVDGTPASTGVGEACLGDPLNALAWLARTAVAVGDPLRAGHIVLSGALGPMCPVESGSVVAAHIEGLGPVRATFGRGEEQR